MKIRSIVVDGVGKFSSRTEVAGLGSGVNILAAGNEEGKSTVFRAVRACLCFHRWVSFSDHRYSLPDGGAVSLAVYVCERCAATKCVPHNRTP